MANLFQFVAILTAVVVTVTQWTLPTAFVAVGCTSSVIAWHWHFDEFCRLNGVDQLAGMPSPLVVAAAGAGFGVFAVELATGPSGSVIAPGGLEFTLGGMGFCAAWVWWWTQELYDFFDAHAIAACPPRPGEREAGCAWGPVRGLQGRRAAGWGTGPMAATHAVTHAAAET